MLKSIFLKIFQGIFEYLLFLPIFLIIGINIINDGQLFNWLIGLFALFTVGIIFRSIFYKQKWWLFSLFSIIVGTSFSFIFADDLLLIVILTLIHVVIVYRGMMYVGQAWDDVLPLPFLWLGGVGTYFVGYFIFRFVDSLSPYLNLITIFGITLIVMTMFVSNNDHLENSTLSKDKKPFVSRTIKNQNRIYLILTILIIALLTNGQMIRNGLWNIFRTILKWIIGFGEGDKDMGQSPPPLTDTPLPFEEQNEPSIIAKFLEMIMTYVMYIVLAAALILLILLLIKKTRIWIKNGFRQIIQFLKGIVKQMTESEESTQYTEEKESVFNWQEWKDEQQSRAKGFIQNIFKRKPNWNSLSNQEKVRFVFRNFLLQEIDAGTFSKYATPRETLEQLKLTARVDESQLEQLRMAYEQTRYGEEDVDEQIINDIYTLIDKR